MSIPSISQPEVSSAAEQALENIRASTSRLFFEPRETVRCGGARVFRSKAARDAACLADVDPAVVQWSCLPLALEHGGRVHVPDLVLFGRDGGATLVDAVHDASRPPKWVQDVAARAGHRYCVLEVVEMEHGFRLENARELLRYANWRVSLNDRVRLVAALEENGPLPIRACMDLLGTRDAIAAIAALALRRFIEIDLDEAPIGPDSRVRPTHRS